jgi:pimeloyl-ACP methyl ester carboxylesterase
MQMARAADGTRLAWRSEGTGSPLLLIAGQATALTGWEPVVPALAKTFRVIRFDHRGVGSSDEGTTEQLGTRAFATDAMAVLDAAGVQRAHVYGHSMGGRVAQWLAIDYPDRVGALILAATSAGGFLGQDRDPDATQALTSGSPARLEPLFFDPAWASAHHEAVHTFFTSRASRQAKRQQFRASKEHDTRHDLGSVRAPTLILHGTADVLTPISNAQVLRDLIPHSMLVKVDGGRHGFHLDHPETVDWIQRFIARKGPQI